MLKSVISNVESAFTSNGSGRTIPPINWFNIRVALTPLNGDSIIKNTEEIIHARSAFDYLEFPNKFLGDSGGKPPESPSLCNLFKDKYFIIKL